MTGVRGKARPISLAVDVKGGLPTEFRLFVSGWNTTDKGSFLFDAEAARLTMAAYHKWGVDLSIDLEHQMLDASSVDPTARDARGWCRLELRADGSLWAVNVKWTADGAARLTQKRQRYVSPAFDFDKKTKRVTEIVNIAITAMPATHHTPALVAASKGHGMNPELISQALDALVAGDTEKCAELLKQIIAEAAGAAQAEPPAEEVAAPEMEMAVDPAAEPPAEEVAACARVLRLSGRPTLSEAFVDVEAWRASHIELERERQKLAAERDTLEQAERRRLCVELVTLGAEFPATIWVDALEANPTLKPRWTSLPLVELRASVAEQRAARGRKRAVTAGRAPIESGAGEKTYQTPNGPVTLTARDHEICADAKCDPQMYATLRAKRGST